MHSYIIVLAEVIMVAVTYGWFSSCRKVSYILDCTQTKQHVASLRLNVSFNVLLS